ncbi:MAG: hypothetical protein WBC34_09540 [Thiofilum sp.]
MAKLIRKELIIDGEEETYIITARVETQSGGADAVILGSGGSPDSAMSDLKLTAEEIIREIKYLLFYIDVWFQMPDKQRFAVLEEEENV